MPFSTFLLLSPASLPFPVGLGARCIWTLNGGVEWILALAISDDSIKTVTYQILGGTCSSLRGAESSFCVSSVQAATPIRNFVNQLGWWLLTRRPTKEERILSRITFVWESGVTEWISRQWDDSTLWGVRRSRSGWKKRGCWLWLWLRL